MALVTFSESIPVGDFSWGLMRRDAVFSSIFGSQGQQISVPLWVASIAQSNLADIDIGPWQVMAMKLDGKVDQLALWNIMRPQPLGTMRGAMTLRLAAAQGAKVLSIVATGENAKTLLDADYLGIGDGITQQVLMVDGANLSNGSGQIEVNLVTPLRNAFDAATVVVWDKPKALFRQTTSKTVWKYGQKKQVSGLSLDLVEDWRPA